MKFSGLKTQCDKTALTRQHKDKHHKRFFVLCLSVIVFVSLVAAFGYFYLALTLPTLSPPSFDQVRKGYRRSDALLLDRHHEVIQELRVNPKARQLDWVSLADISPALKSTMVFAEDRRFYEHGGVDWRALAGAARERFSQKSLRGASTLTMQVAAKLNHELQPRLAHRSFAQKLQQLFAAQELEKRWSKSEILEAYFNLVTFRGELQGIAAASKGLFKKEPQGLDSSESVILAALVRSPNAPFDQVASRACELSESMKLQPPCPEISIRAKEALSVPYLIHPDVALAPQVAQRLLEPLRSRSKEETLRVVSTLEGELQRFVIDTLQQHLFSVRDRNVHDGAVLVVENKSGEVLAYVGNLGDRASARFVDGIQARRQAGSILKPFLYGLAIDRRLITAASLIDDAPVDIPAPNGIYRPENYDNQFHGLVTARVALASSLNIPAVKLLMLLGVDPFLKELRALGFRDLQSPEFYGPSLALGSADITLWDLVNAYRTLANGGAWSPLRLTFEEKNTGSLLRVLSRDATFIISDILSDRESRSETFALESPLSTRFWTAVKTGTSKDMRDNWAVGFSSRYTVGVWAGNFSGEPMWNVSGITGAAPVWVEIMNWLHRHEPSIAPLPPSRVTLQRIDIAALGKQTREWFIQGTENTEVQEASTPTNFRIVYPANETIIALDPDIPEDQQRLFFESRPSDPTLRWALDGTDLGPAGSVLIWNPIRGAHRLRLVDASHRILDSVNFEVRGNLRGSLSSLSPPSTPPK